MLKTRIINNIFHFQQCFYLKGTEVESDVPSPSMELFEKLCDVQENDEMSDAEFQVASASGSVLTWRFSYSDFQDEYHANDLSKSSQSDVEDRNEQHYGAVWNREHIEFSNETDDDSEEEEGEYGGWWVGGWQVGGWWH